MEKVQEQFDYEAWNKEISWQKGMDDYRDYMCAYIKSNDDDDDDEYDDELLDYDTERDNQSAIEGYLYGLEELEHYLEETFKGADKYCDMVYDQAGSFRAKLHEEMAAWEAKLEEAERRVYSAKKQLERAREW